MILPWLPIMAVLFFFTVSRGEVLACGPDACVLEAQKGFKKRADAVNRVSVERDEDTKRPTLVIDANGVSRFDLGDRVGPAFEAYTESRQAKTPVRIPVAGRSWWVMFGSILGLELLLVVYYTVAQRAITIVVETETGRARILQRARMRTRELTAFELGDVKEFDFLDLDEEAMGRAVIAVMKKNERRRLFDAVNVEAGRGKDFLEEAHAAWVARGEP